jgi:hypothetical protein
MVSASRRGRIGVEYCCQKTKLDALQKENRQMLAMVEFLFMVITGLERPSPHAYGNKVNQYDHYVQIDTLRASSSGYIDVIKNISDRNAII